jgi:uncharacterized protein DUF4403
MQAWKLKCRDAFTRVLSFAAILILTCFSLTGCCTHSPPVLPSNPAQIPPAPDSRAELPLNFDVGPTLSQLEKEIPNGEEFWEAWNMNGDDGIKYHWRRSPLSIYIGQDYVTVWCRVWYEFKTCHMIGHWHAPVDHKMGTFEAYMQTQLFWKGNWSIGSYTRLYGGIPFDIVRDKLQQYAGRIDNRIRSATANAANLAPNTWSSASRPVRISANPEVWLVVNPTKAYATPIRSSGTIFGTSVGIIARPHVEAGSQPAVNQNPLPSFVLHDSNPGKIFVYLEANASYDEANKQLATLKGQTFTSWKKYVITVAEAERHGLHLTAANNGLVSIPGFFTIKDININGGGNYALLSVTVRGVPFSGTIYFIGQLHYDPDKYLLTVENLDYKAASNDVFVLIADWAAHGKLVDQLRAKSRWNLGNDIEDARVRLQSGFARALPAYILVVRSIDPLAIYATAHEFKVAVDFVGEISPARAKFSTRYLKRLAGSTKKAVNYRR